VPIVSEYETIPPITGFSEISAEFPEIEGLATWTPVVSAAAHMRIGKNFVATVPLFGVDNVTYFSVCSDVVIESGDIGALSSGGVFLNSVLASAAEARLKRPLKLGEPITFSMYSNGSFKIRKGSFTGVQAYPGGTEVMSRLVLADPTIVRGLADYTLGYIAVGSSEAAAADSGSIDDLFSSPADVDALEGQGLTLGTLEERLADTAERDLFVSPDAAAWSFVLFKAEPGREAEMLESFRSTATREGWDVRIMDWRGAAGSSAQALFAVQGAFYVGMGFIALGAILVIMNALVISVLERTAEIGTMRGLGANAGFISRLFIAESMLLTMTAAAIGLALGLAVTVGTSRAGIPIENPLLVSLFGGSVLRPLASPRSLALHAGLAAAVGALAWIYPVSLALRVQPISAMSEG